MFGRENKFDVNRFAKSIDKCAHPMLCYTREPADVRDLKVKFRRLLWLDTCYGSCVVTFSGIPQHRVRTLVNRFCKPVDIKLVFSTFKINNSFNVKDPLPDRLRTRVVYNFPVQVVMLVTSVKQADTSLRPRALIVGQIFARL